MTTLAQVQAVVVNLNNNMDSLINTFVDKLNPDKATTPQVIALLNDTKAQINQVLTDALAKAQGLGVI